MIFCYLDMYFIILLNLAILISSPVINKYFLKDSDIYEKTYKLINIHRSIAMNLNHLSSIAASSLIGTILLIIPKTHCLQRRFKHILYANTSFQLVSSASFVFVFVVLREKCFKIMESSAFMDDEEIDIWIKAKPMFLG